MGDVPMREDCRHFESRSYEESGDTVRYCVLGLAPEQPWRCPENCASYEPTLIDGTFERGKLVDPPVEVEPDDTPDNIEGVLADAEAIVEAAEADALRGLADEPEPKRRWWSRRRRPPADGGDFRISDR
jgi:hypothetical protein